MAHVCIYALSRRLNVCTLFFVDLDHSLGEDRFLLLGLSSRAQALVVCHCYRESNLVVRIISARRADKREEEEYWIRRK